MTTAGAPGPPSEDTGPVASALADWLGERLPGSGEVHIGPVEKPGSGLSGGTLLVEARRGEGSLERSHRLVVRMPPAQGKGLFPASDLGREHRFMLLLERSGVPLAPVVGLEEDPSVLGRPFLVTRRVEGRLIDSTTPYLSRGWLHDESEPFQSRLIRSFLGVMATIHRCDLSARVATEFGDGRPDGVAGALERWSRYLEWADDAAAAPDQLHDALAWCRANSPPNEPEHSLVWGDAQLANAVFGDDGSTLAVLDFELAAVGPAELDLGWLFCLHDMTVARCGQDLPGFGDRRGQVEIYQELLGRPVDDLSWYETFAAVCTASILVRVATLLGKGGADMAWLARSNPALDYLASRLT
ncbi:MAG: phosphotransferase family protein [Acidimicrobiales bacterium]